MTTFRDDLGFLAKLVLAVGLLLAGACARQEAAEPSGASAAEPAASAEASEGVNDTKPLVHVTLQTDWYAEPEHGGFYQALARGFYREAGLDVEILQGGPGNVTLQKVASGQVDFGLTRSDDIMLAVSRGVPLMAVGATMQHDPQAVIVHAESSVHTLADLGGCTLMAVPGTAWQELVQKRYGIRLNLVPSTYSLVQFLADPKLAQQCFITSEPYYLRQKGVAIRTIFVSESGFDPYRVIVATRDTVTKRPDVVRAFAVASARGWADYVDGDPAPANAMIAERNKEMTPDFLAYSRGALIEHRLVAGDPAKGERAGRLTRARLQAQLTTLRELGLIDHDIPVDDVAALDLLPPELRD